MERSDIGPLDPSVLTLQNVHRSELVWEHEYTDPLHCRRREAVISRVTATPDSRILPYLRQSGFYGVWSVGFISLDWHLITALVERWRQETHTFHLPHGECTITLQDVSVLWGLPVNGLAVIGSVDLPWVQICTDLLGVTPNIKGSRIHMPWLAEQFNHFAHLPSDASEQDIQRYARAFILMLIGGIMFPTKSNNFVNLMYLPLLQNFEVTSRFSWGGACLAYLYRELCKASFDQAKEIAGPLVLLQMWAWERFSTLAPRRINLIENNLEDRPLGARWNDNLHTTEVSTHILVQYRYILDTIRPDQIIWEPYRDLLARLPDYCHQGHEIWAARVPLICFCIVEWHFPDRVMRQFGMIQRIPILCNTDLRLHTYDLRGRSTMNWIFILASELALWEDRAHSIIFGDPVIDHNTDVEYISWYNSITLRYLTRVGASLEYMRHGVSRLASFTDSPEAAQLATRLMTCLDYIGTTYRVHHPSGVQPPQMRTRLRHAPAPANSHIPAHDDDEDQHDLSNEAPNFDQVR